MLPEFSFYKEAGQYFWKGIVNIIVIVGYMVSVATINPTIVAY